MKCIEEESELMFDDDQTGSQETLRGVSMKKML